MDQPEQHRGPGFDMGRCAGETRARLDGHDKQFTELKHSIAEVLTEVGKLNLAVQALGLDAKANAATVVTTAAALKDAKDTQEAAGRAEAVKADKSWSPISRLMAVSGGVAAIGSLYLSSRPG